ncbi:hypothetical protein P1N98_12910, partial [Tsukamurella tyrosinosolvens]
MPTATPTRAPCAPCSCGRGEGSPSGELWRPPASERAVYLDPYIEHCPGSLFVAEDGHDVPVLLHDDPRRVLG